jgi:hypothetical protein
MKKSTIIFVIGAFIIAGSLYFMRNKIVGNVAPNQIVTSATPVSTIETEQETLEGNRYDHPSGAYSFVYPNDYTLESTDTHYIRIFKRAETARPQGELSDGVLMVFEAFDLEGRS